MAEQIRFNDVYTEQLSLSNALQEANYQICQTLSQ